MAQPMSGDVHVNRPLTNISVAFLQSPNAFVAHRLFPQVPIARQSDLYYTYPRGAFNRDEMAARAPGTESQGSGYDIDTGGPYYCTVWAYHKDVADQTRANADTPFDLDREATLFVTRKGMIRREKQFISNFFTTGKWTTDITGVSATPGSNQVLKWSDDASDPISNVKAARAKVAESTGFEANVMLLGRSVYDKLTLHPDIVDRIKYGQTPGSPAIVTKQALAALFEVDEILVGNAIENTAAEGAAATHSFIAGSHALLVHRPAAPGIMTPAAGYTFVWNGYVGMEEEGVRIKRFRMEELASDRIEGEMAFDMHQVAADLGYFFSSIV